MKTLFLTTALAVLAAEAVTQQLYTGARFDASAMKWTFSDQYRVPIEYPFTDGSVKPLWGFQVSFPVEYRLNKWLGFQTEIGFAKRGFALKLTGDEQGCDITATARTTFRYFDFPLLIKTYLTHGTKEFYLLAGPSYSKVRDGKIHVAVTVNCGGDSDSDSDSEPLDLEDYPKNKNRFRLIRRPWLFKRRQQAQGVFGRPLLLRAEKTKRGRSRRDHLQSRGSAVGRHRIRSAPQMTGHKNFL